MVNDVVDLHILHGTSYLTEVSQGKVSWKYLSFFKENSYVQKYLQGSGFVCKKS